MLKANNIFFSLSLIIFIVCVQSNLSAQELTMFPSLSGFGGYEYYQDEIQIDKSKMKSLMSLNAETEAYWQIVHNAKVVGVLSGVVGLGSFIWLITESVRFDDKSVNVLELASFWTTIGSGIMGVIYMTRSIKYRKKAILRYNRQLDKGYNFQPSSTGIGVCMNF